MSASRRRRRLRLGLTVSTAQTAVPRCQAKVTGSSRGPSGVTVARRATLAPVNRSSTSAGGPSAPARPPLTASALPGCRRPQGLWGSGDRKSTRLNSSHVRISYAVFCLKKKKQTKKNICYQINKKKKKKE